MLYTNPKNVGYLEFVLFFRNLNFDSLTNLNRDIFISNIHKKLCEFLKTKSIFKFKISKKGTIESYNDNQSKETIAGIIGKNYQWIENEKSLAFSTLYINKIPKLIFVVSKLRIQHENLKNNDNAIIYFFSCISKYLSQIYPILDNLTVSSKKYKHLLGPKFIRYMTDKFLAYNVIELIKYLIPEADVISIWRTSKKENKLQLIAEKNKLNIFEEKLIDLPPDSIGPELTDIIVNYEKENYTINNLKDFVINEKIELNKIYNNINSKNFIRDLLSNYYNISSGKLCVLYPDHSIDEINQIRKFNFIIVIGADSLSIDKSNYIYLKELINDAKRIFYFVSLSRYTLHLLNQVQKKLLIANSHQDINECINLIINNIITNESNLYKINGFILFDISNPKKILLNSNNYVINSEYPPDEWHIIKESDNRVYDYQNIDNLESQKITDFFSSIFIVNGDEKIKINSCIVTILHTKNNKYALLIFRDEKRGLRPFDRLTLETIAPLLEGAIQNYSIELNDDYSDAHIMYFPSIKENNYNFILNYFLKKLLVISKTEFGHIYLLNENLNTLFFGSGFGCLSEKTFYHTNIDVNDNSLIGYVAINKEMVHGIVKDNYFIINDTLKIPYLSWIPNIKYAIAFPIKKDNTLIGVVTLAFDNVKLVKHELITELSNEISKLYESLNNYNQTHILKIESILNNFLLFTFSESDSIENIEFANLCKKIAEIANCQNVTIRRYDPTSDSLIRVGSFGVKSDAHLINLNDDVSVNMYLFKNKLKHIYLPNVNDRIFYNQIYHGLKYLKTRDTTKSELCIAIMDDNGNPFGTINLESHSYHGFRDIVSCVEVISKAVGIYYKYLIKKEQSIALNNTYAMGIQLAERAHEVKNTVLELNSNVSKILENENITLESKTKIYTLFDTVSKFWLGNTENLKEYLLSNKGGRKDLLELMIEIKNYYKKYNNKIVIEIINKNDKKIILIGIHIELLKIAIINFIRNSIRLSHEEITKINILLKKEIRLEGYFIVIEIIDNGPGFSKESRDVFQLSKNDNVRNKINSGIGLWIIGNYLKSMNINPVISKSVDSEKYHVQLWIPVKAMNSGDEYEIR